MKIILIGAGGRMGRQILALAGGEIVAAVDPTLPADLGVPTYKTLEECKEDADCIIDFALHTATPDVMAYAEKKKLPVVLAPTGHTQEEEAAIREACKTIPVFVAANLSIGIAVLCRFAREAAKLFPEAEIEIIECHHNKKLDVPSGTALMLSRAVREACPEKHETVGRRDNGLRDRREIGIHSLRTGNVVGEHEIIIATPTETLKLSHEAHSRALFAEGALAAAEFLCGGLSAGIYSMGDMLQK